MIRAELPSSLSSTEVLSLSSIIPTVKNEEKEEGDGDTKDDNDNENHQWIDFFENITNNYNSLDDEDDGNDYHVNKGASAGRSSSSSINKTEAEVPDSIPSKSSIIGMEEEEEEDAIYSSRDNDDKDDSKYDNDNHDDDNDNDGNKGTIAVKSSVSSIIKTEEEEIPDNIPRKSITFEMEEKEKENEVYSSITNNTLVWGDGTITGSVTACVDQQQQQADATMTTATTSTDGGIIPYVTTSNSNSDSGNKITRKRRRRRDYDTTSDDNKRAFSGTEYEDDDHDYANDNDHKDEDDEGTLASSSSEKKMRHSDNITTSNNNKAVRSIFEQQEENEECNDKMNDNNKVAVSSMVVNDVNGDKDQNCINNNDGDGSGGGGVSTTTTATITTKGTDSPASIGDDNDRKLLPKRKTSPNRSLPQSRGREQSPSSKSRNRSKSASGIRGVNANGTAPLSSSSVSATAKNIFDTNWMEMYQKLVAYKKQHNDSTKVPRNYKKDPKLGQWVGRQRVMNNNNKVLPDRYSLLDSIDFDWGNGSQGPHWMEMYQRLVEYKKQHSNTNVPFRYKEDLKLGIWVHNQCHAYKNKDKYLSEERCTLLDSIGFE